MVVRRLQTRDVAEAVARVRQELGEGAVILDMRPVRGWSFLGLGARPRLEVVAATDADADVVVAEGVGGEGKAPGAPPALARLQRQLVAHRMRGELVTHLVQGMARTLPPRLLADDRAVLEALAPELARLCPCRAPGQAPEQGARAVFLVGPSGAGRTTTAARLAWALVRAGTPVALAAADARRVGDAERLAAWGEALGVRVVHTDGPAALGEALAVAEGGVLVVDAPGLPGVLGEVGVLLPLVEAAPIREVLLVVEATTRHEEAVALARRLAPLDLDGLVVTRLDQAVVYGDIVNTAALTCLPLAYLCQGRSPLQPPLPASAQLLVELLLRPVEGESPQEGR